MEETFKSSHDAFRSAFPRGFAWELISVYSGPPMVAYKFKHWGLFKGPVLTPIAETQQNKSADASTSLYCPFSDLLVPNKL
ncbi:hypothetical protein CUMW_284260, partial [Citrus unshiu]